MERSVITIGYAARSMPDALFSWRRINYDDGESARI